MIEMKSRLPNPTGQSGKLYSYHSAIRDNRNNSGDDDEG